MKKELTKREKEVLKLISEGKTAKEISKQLGISKRTVEAHTSNMLQKTGANNSAHLVAMWYEGVLKSEMPPEIAALPAVIRDNY